MKFLLCLLVVFVLGCNGNSSNLSTPSVPPIATTSMRIVEYSDVSDPIFSSPRLHVWVVADAKRNLCFVVFRSGEGGVTVVKFDCDGVKPQVEKIVQ